ncbi:MAG: 4Fe-4S binding protein, partial [Anaerolineae bacterium]
MARDNPHDGQVIAVSTSIAGPRRSGLQRRSVGPGEHRKPSEHSSTASADRARALYLEVARMYSSPLLMGPPICDELIALVEHMYTEEEASLVRHLRPLPGKTAEAVAAAAHRTVEEARLILEQLAHEKFLLLSSGAEDHRRYHLMPIVPGTFEMAMVRTSLDTLTAWHRRFAELFSVLYETGFFVDYADHPVPWVRYVPVGETIEAHPQALPSDRLEEVLDRYTTFAVGLCQCRVAEEIVGRGCERPVENCVVFGNVAELLIHHGKMRRAEKGEILEIKAAAAAAGLASFVAEIELRKNGGGAACSCCGCCCGALRTISQFNAPGLIAPPHFLPEVELDKCTYCGRCASACPVGATVVDV